MGTSVSNVITVTTAAAGVAPGPATGLVVSNLATTSLTLSWVAPAAGTLPFFYQPQRAPQGSSSWTNIGSPISAPTVAVSGLTPNVAYQFQVITSNATGSSTSAAVPATTLSVIPGAPTGLAVVGSPTQTNVSLQWNAPPSGTQPFTYLVSYRSPSGAGSFTPFSTTTTALTQTITGLTAASGYDFVVSASNLAGTGSQSIILANVQTPGIAGSAPGPATGLVVSGLGATSLTLSWVAPTTGTLPFLYQPEQAPAGANPAWTNIGSPISATTISVTGLSGNTAYQFLVSTSNSAGSSLSSTVGATTLPVAPASPTALTLVGSPTQTSVTLQWTAPATGTPPLTYQVSLRTPSGSGSFIPFATTTTSLSQQITGLTAGASYDFAVSASNTAGTSAPSGTLGNIQTAPANSAPGAATGLAISNLTANSLTLSWAAPSSGTTPFAYQPQQAPQGSSAWANVGGSIITTTVAVTGLVANTAYQFQVLTSNSVGTSTSAAIATTTLAVLPSAPTGLAVVGSPTQTTVALQWAAPATGSAPLSYQVSLRTPSGAGSFIAAGATTSGLTQTITGLSPSTSYDFDVSASNTAGSGPQSAVLTNIQTASAPNIIPSAPTNLTAGTVTSTSIAMSWTAPATGTPPLSYVVQSRLH